ncbi:hypothetical protein EC988_001198 [Linderina pennispora]|nr:hypothetical protein EC988_001198 [Linderina pennispora]
MPLLKRSAENDEFQTPRARTCTTAAARMRDTERTVRRSVAMTSTKKAFFLLLKSFIGSGVLFLPRAFLNGGIVFSSIILSISAMLSLYCMTLLVECYQRIPHGYSEIGRRLYGKGMGRAVQFSIVISQTGFACAGTIFVATNIRDLFNAATDCQYRYSLGFWVAAQLAFMIPVCLIRHIKGLSSFALFGDLFVLGGIVYVFVMDIKKISTLGTGFVRKFNPEDYSLFLGTAAYTFEGYAMILPIADSMRKPEKFPQILTIVMALCGLITVTIGSVSYLAYGEETETIILLNMPSGTAATLTVQLLYSIAMLLTNPLMVYPAIRTLEHWLFPRRSGKHNVGVKMQKNAFRTSFLLAVTAIAVFGLDRLDKLVAIIGGSACVPISFIFPPLFHYRAVARTTRAKVIDLALAGFGVVACVYVTYNAIKRWGIAVPPSDFCDLAP